MKKSMIFSALIAVLVLAAEHTVHAAPSSIIVAITCPPVDGTSEGTLTNYGGVRVGGYGNETVAGQEGYTPYFSGPIAPGAQIPDVIASANYASSAASFNPVTQAVTCSYTSATKDKIDVSYFIVNGSGANVMEATATTIKLRVFVGK